MNKPDTSKASLYFGASLTAVGIILFYANSLFAQTSSEQSKVPLQESKNQRMTREAFEALNSNRFDVAIAKADECIDEFRRAAARLQEELKKKKEPEPPVGEVSDESKKKNIFSWGPLNDVAACYFIKGEANLKLSRRAEDKKKGSEYRMQAKRAYEEAAKLTYARTWDPTPPGWFWNPAQRANELLEDMEAIRP